MRRSIAPFLPVLSGQHRGTSTLVVVLASRVPPAPLANSKPGSGRCRTLAQSDDLGGTGITVPDQEWTKTPAGGRSVKFTYQELPEDGAFISAQSAGNQVVYSIVLPRAVAPLSRDQVESYFAGELSKK